MDWRLRPPGGIIGGTLSTVEERVAALLAELHRHGVEHDAARSDRLERLRNVEPDTGRVLALLVRATGARRLLEIGTSNGCSTIWLADALRSTGGRMLTVDTDADRSAQAARNLERAGLADRVELRVEDAADTLRAEPDASTDMVFLDAERPFYPSYWPDLVRVLRPGGLLAVDNVISHAGQVAGFRALVAADERVTEALVPTGAGLLLAVTQPRSVSLGEPPNRAR
jgi:predicted O-methyltransferase YrrM